MIELPDFTRAFEYENNFYLSCDNTRLSKILAHYELFKLVQNLPGAIVECGVFKGASFVRFAGFRNLFGNPFSHKLIGFDTFDAYPETDYAPDKLRRETFITEAGNQSISVNQLWEVLRHKGADQNVELIAGDILLTLPDYVVRHPELRISLLNLDTDIYEPAVEILRFCWPLIVKGGILIIDDYGVFPGETQAIDDYFSGMNIQILKFPFAMTPCYIIKDD